jgi:hypothetical protein
VLLKLNYYNFSSNFDIYIKFCSEIVNVDAEVIHSMIHMRHRALRCCPQQWSTPMAPSNMGSNHPESGPPTNSRPQHHWKGKKNYLHKLGQQGKNWATKAQQDRPANMIINSWLLHMQGTKGLMRLRTMHRLTNTSYAWPWGLTYDNHS